MISQSAAYIIRLRCISKMLAPSAVRCLSTGSSKSSNIAEHYEQGNILKVLEDGIAAIGKTKSTVTSEDLAPACEFHTGGREATVHFVERMEFQPSDAVLDVGAGLGGPARYISDTFGCHVTGIDLTAEYVDVANNINKWTNMDDKITMVVGNAFAMQFEDAVFDKAYMMHVGMNIEDKYSLAREISRVVKPGGLVGVFDVVKVGPDEMLFPLPWASEPAESFVDSVETYRSTFGSAGLVLEHQTSQMTRAQASMQQMQQLRDKLVAANAWPAPLGLHLPMGSNMVIKMQNYTDAVSTGKAGPYELYFRKA
eukprot:m.126683 g.126683  ORF g.126683 m.126683 type:complete len:311 (+) comp17384_c0_seq1:96-1028(+)